MKVKLKPIGEDEDYDIYYCAASRCLHTSEIILATGPKDYGLCQKHWLQYCEEKKNDINEKTG